MNEALSTKTEIDFDPRAADVRPRALLYLVLEADDPLGGGARYSLDEVDEVVVGRGQKGCERQVARAVVNGKRQLDIRAGGPFLSKDHAVFRRNDEEWTVADLGSSNGVQINWAPIEAPTVLKPGDIVSLGRLYFFFQIEEAEELGDVDTAKTAGDPAGFVTVVPDLERRLARLRQEAVRNTSITLIGETGTGKEVTADAIHKLSGRRGPYLALNCGAIPRDLIQSELFGHAKGAFSGASENRNGFVREAHQGTLLLDEIIAAPEQVQVSLLRVLQERAVTPIGARHPQPVDVRFIAAAQSPLAEAVAAGKFRADLRARLATFSFDLPPLRERLEDIGVLVAAKLRTLGVEPKDRPRLSSAAAMRLLRYHWPDNVRELAQSVDVAWGAAKDGEMGEDEAAVDDSLLPRPLRAGREVVPFGLTRFRHDARNGDGGRRALQRHLPARKVVALLRNRLRKSLASWMCAVHATTDRRPASQDARRPHWHLAGRTTDVATQKQLLHEPPALLSALAQCRGWSIEVERATRLMFPQRDADDSCADRRRHHQGRADRVAALVSILLRRTSSEVFESGHGQEREREPDRGSDQAADHGADSIRRADARHDRRRHTLHAAVGGQKRDLLVVGIFDPHGADRQNAPAVAAWRKRLDVLDPHRSALGRQPVDVGNLRSRRRAANGFVGGARGHQECGGRQERGRQWCVRSFQHDGGS